MSEISYRCVDFSFLFFFFLRPFGENCCNVRIYPSFLLHLNYDDPQDNENSAGIMRRYGYQDGYFLWSRSTRAITIVVIGLVISDWIGFDGIIVVSAKRDWLEYPDKNLVSLSLSLFLASRCFRFVRPVLLVLRSTSRGFGFEWEKKYATKDKSRAVNVASVRWFELEDRRVRWWLSFQMNV